MNSATPTMVVPPGSAPRGRYGLGHLPERLLLRYAPRADGRALLSGAVVARHRHAGLLDEAAVRGPPHPGDGGHRRVQVGADGIGDEGDRDAGPPLLLVVPDVQPAVRDHRVALHERPLHVAAQVPAPDVDGDVG